MVVPRQRRQEGAEFARSLGMTYEHSEHALRLGARPDGVAADPALALRQATTTDLPELSRLYCDGFGGGDVDESRLTGERSYTLMITRHGEPIGTIALARDGARERWSTGSSSASQSARQRHRAPGAPPAHAA